MNRRKRLKQIKLYSRDAQSYEDIMLKIATLFNKPIKTIKRVDYEKYYVSVNSVKCLAKIKNYFEISPFMNSNFLDYQCWLIAYNMILNKSHLTDIGKENIFSLRNNMNSKQTLFHWDHLDRFYF